MILLENRNELIEELNTLIKRIKIFSQPEFKSVYSSSYFNHIIKPIYNNTNQKYSLIFGDFNKLGLLNETQGHEFGDMALKLSMQIINASLPSNARIIREGGDEIYIIFPNTEKNLANKYKRLIQKNMENNSIFLRGLSISLACEDSSFGNIDELIKKTDNEVLRIKSRMNNSTMPSPVSSQDFLPLAKPENITKSESKTWNTLNYNLNIAIYNFLQNYRPSKDFKFDRSQLLDSSGFILDSFISLLNPALGTNLKHNDIKFNNTDLDEFSKYKESKDRKNILFDEKFCKSLDNFVLNNFDDEIEKYSNDDIKNLISNSNLLIESLIRDDTGLFSKNYFRKVIVPQIVKSDKNFSASYLSISGIKLSNAAFDHVFTDFRMDKTNSLILDAANRELNFNNKSFDFSNDLYFLSQGGGNYLLLYPKEVSDEMSKKMDIIADYVNSKYDPSDSSTSFKVSNYSLGNDKFIDNSNTNNTIKYVRKIKDKTNSQKCKLKKELFKSSDTYFAFKNSITPCIQYYINNVKHSKSDINKISIFVRNIYKSFLNQEVLHNEQSIIDNKVGPEI